MKNPMKRMFMIVGTTLIGLYMIWLTASFINLAQYVGLLEQEVDQQIELIEYLEHELLHRAPGQPGYDLDFQHEYILPWEHRPDLPPIEDVEENAETYWSA